MESKKLWDVDQYKQQTKETPKGGVHENNKSQSSQKKIKLEPNELVTDEDGNELAISDWLPTLEDNESRQVHCPISPEKHTNGDASASCSMQRNGDYLNLKCFGCDGTAYYTTRKENKKMKNDEVEYSIPTFNKEEALKHVDKNLGSLDEILEVMIKYLPQLEKK